MTPPASMLALLLSLCLTLMAAPVSAQLPGVPVQYAVANISAGPIPYYLVAADQSTGYSFYAFANEFTGPVYALDAQGGIAAKSQFANTAPLWYFECRPHNGLLWILLDVFYNTTLEAQPSFVALDASSLELRHQFPYPEQLQPRANFSSSSNFLATDSSGRLFLSQAEQVNTGHTASSAPPDCHPACTDSCADPLMAVRCTSLTRAQAFRSAISSCPTATPGTAAPATSSAWTRATRFERSTPTSARPTALWSPTASTATALGCCPA